MHYLMVLWTVLKARWELLRREPEAGYSTETVLVTALLVALAIVPGPTSAARPCTNRACQSAGLVRWARLLPGAWVAQAGLAGTTPAQGAAYAAMGGHIAVIGIGTTVFAYQSRSGAPAWDSSLAGFRAGSRIVSVRTWPGVITVGVDVPGRRAGSLGTRHEVILDSGTGRLLRSVPAAPFGGAVAAGRARVAGVGGKERAVAFRGEQQGGVGAGQAGEVPDVLPGGDEGGVRT